MLRRYFIFILLSFYLIGCSDKDLCNLSNGINIELKRQKRWDCENNLHGEKNKSLDSCYDVCYSFGQGYVNVLQYSRGVCICNNEEGRKAIEGYHKFLNKKCGNK
jgi:hypothetical protein